jgi:hypothetical protein
MGNLPLHHVCGGGVPVRRPVFVAQAYAESLQVTNNDGESSFTLCMLNHAGTAGAMIPVLGAEACPESLRGGPTMDILL